MLQLYSIMWIDIKCTSNSASCVQTIVAYVSCVCILRCLWIKKNHVAHPLSLCQGFDAACKAILISVGGNTDSALAVFTKWAVPVTWLLCNENAKGECGSMSVRNSRRSIRVSGRRVPYEANGNNGEKRLWGGCFFVYTSPSLVYRKNKLGIKSS